MKKLIAILAVMIAFVGTVFAVSGETLQINATVLPVAPIFSIYGGKTANATTTQGANPASSITFTSVEKDLSTQDITVYIRLVQTNKAKYNSTASLTIEATPLVNQTIQEGTYKTAAPVAANIVASNVNGITYLNDPSSSTVGENTVVTFSPKYDGRSIQATDIGTFNLTWGHNDNLTVGEYKATITMTYEAN